AVDVDVIHNHILSVLVLDALGAFVELLPVFLGPPVFQIAFGVILAALIVKTVGQLMPNGASGIAVVGSVVDLGVVQGRLQDSGRKVDVIHLGVVVGIYGGRRHAPFAMVHGFANFIDIAMGLELRGPGHVRNQIIRYDLDG